MSVSDGGREEGGRTGRKEGGRGGGADTELKTKTPHVNVGKNGTPQLFESLRDEYRPHPGNRTERKENERSGVVAVESNLAVLGHSLA